MVKLASVTPRRIFASLDPEQRRLIPPTRRPSIAAAQRSLRTALGLTLTVAACSLLSPTDAELAGGAAAPVRNEGGGGGCERPPTLGEGGTADSSASGGALSGTGAAAAGEGADCSSAGQTPSTCGGSATGGTSAGEAGAAGAAPADACDGKCSLDEQCVNARCISQSGCNDGTREGFVDRVFFPAIAGCHASWSMSSMRAPKTGERCGKGLRACQVPADACGKGWHVCAAPPYGPADVSAKVTADDCLAQNGSFAAAVGDVQCEPCTPSGDGAACCGTTCVQQNGDCIYPDKTAWFGVISNHKNTCAEIESFNPLGGVLCCRD